MNRMSLEEQERLVQVLYHPGVFEVHQPRLFSLKQPGVEIINRESKNDAESASLFLLSQPIIEAAFLGKTPEVLRFCKEHEDFSNISGKLCNDAFNVTLLGAAILGGHVALVKALLDLGIKTSRNEFCMVNEDSLSISPLILVFCLTNPSADWNIRSNKVAAFEIMRFLVEKGTVDRKNPHIRHPLPVTSEDLDLGLSAFCADPDYILYLLNILGKQLNPSDLPLELAVNSRSIPLVEKMFSLGAEVDSWFKESTAVFEQKFGCLVSGCTPLLIAAAHGDEPMVRLLLGYKASINQEFSASFPENGKDLACTLVHNLEGYTPLLVAVEEGHLSLVQLLIKKGAHVLHRSALGKTALSIAFEKGHEHIIAYLENVLALNKDTKERIDFQKTTQEAAKIHERYTRIIFTGKEVEGHRFFVVRQDEKNTIFPFIGSMPTRLFNGVSKEIVLKKMINSMNRNYNLDIQLANLRWGSVGELSCHVPEDEIYYVDNVIFCELDNPLKIKEKISVCRYHTLKLVKESDLICESEEQRPIQNLWLPKMTAALFSYINKMLLSSEDKVCKEEHEALNTHYQATLRAQHQLLQAAKTGDIAKIEALLHQGAALWCSTPTLEALADSNTKDLRRVSWQIAIQNNQLDCALYILKKLPEDSVSRLHQFITFEMMAKIVAAGHAPLYQAIHETEYERTDFSKAPESVYGLFDVAKVFRHPLLVSYIANCISPGSVHALSPMAEAIELKDFDRVLELLKTSPDTIDVRCLHQFTTVQVLVDIVQVGHLDLYKTMYEKKHAYTDFSQFSELVEAFFNQAIVAGHQPLACYIADCISGNVLSAMMEAIQSKDCDRAFELLKTVPETTINSRCLNNYLNFDVIDQVIASGHLEFCKALHERGLQNMVGTASLYRAINCYQEPIALYILQSLRPEETHRQVLIGIAQLNGLMNVVGLLSSFMPEEQPVLETPVRLFTPGFQEVRDETTTPGTDEKAGDSPKIEGPKHINTHGK